MKDTLDCISRRIKESQSCIEALNADTLELTITCNGKKIHTLMGEKLTIREILLNRYKAQLNTDIDKLKQFNEQWEFFLK